MAKARVMCSWCTVAALMVGCAPEGGNAVGADPAPKGTPGDVDGDGIDDGDDNCLEVFNPLQTDASDLNGLSDGIGNACDVDYDNDGFVGLLDWATFLRHFGRVSPVEVDPSGEGRLTASDFATFLRYYDGPVGIPGTGNQDGDGFAAPVDCDDSDPDARPDQPETCEEPAPEPEPDPGVDTAEPEEPTRGACTDGVDCLCDRLASDADIVFCEDFEDPDYNGWPDEASTYDEGNLWVTRYNALGWGVQDGEGSCASCDFNIVAESDGQCEVGGETDCVLDGNQAFGHRFVPGDEGGIVGETHIENVTTFGVTYAFKFSENFVDPIVALKSNEFGGQNASCFLGCSTWNAGDRNLPFGWGLVGSFSVGELLVGTYQDYDSGSLMSFNVEPQQYEWRGTKRAGDDPDKVVAAPGRWVCQQVHWRDWGTDHAEFRGFIDGKLVQHVRGLDMTGMKGPTGEPSDDLEGIDFFVFNHYYNEGYQGDEAAYRYEDNLVITRGDEPVPCSTIGL